MKRAQGIDDLRDFLREVVYKINRQSCVAFELNETSSYYSIQVTEKKKSKNAVCFVKDEPVLSINVYANIKSSLFEIPPFNKLTKRSTAPRGLQLRKESWYKYPHHSEYDFEKDKDANFKLCQKACENFRP